MIFTGDAARLLPISGARGVPLRVTAVGAAYLLRPDQHVCARWLTLDATRLPAAFNIALPQ